MSTNPKLRLASYNIRKCVGLDRRRRPTRIIDILNSLDADMIALQEADRRLGDRPAALPARLIEDETDFHAVQISNDGPSIGWHGNAVLVRKDINVTNVEIIELPGTEPRGALAVELEDLTIVATHFGLLRRDRRRQQAAILSAVNGAASSTVILGDFNEWSHTRGLEPLCEAYTIHSPGRSYHAARPVAALDRLALGTDVTLTDAGVVETPRTRIASDHLPIWADISPIS
jgi:endonuclease/exonuclease/phosphatase family metal-dependent hydrolase